MIAEAALSPARPSTIPRNRSSTEMTPAKRQLIYVARRAVSALYGALSRPVNLITRVLLRLQRTHPAVGTSIPRFYWHEYLTAHADALRGVGLEIDTAETLIRYGASRLTRVEVLDAWPSPHATHVADLADGWRLPSDAFDTFLLQFTLHIIEHDRDALYHSLRVLRPGGKLVCNFPSMSGYPHEGLAYGSQRAYVERWYTANGVWRLLSELVPSSAVHLEIFGNRLAVACYASGIAAEAIGRRPLLKLDPHWPVLICATVTKPESWTPVHVPRTDAATVQDVNQ